MSHDPAAVEAMAAALAEQSPDNDDLRDWLTDRAEFVLDALTANPLPHPWQPMDNFPDDDERVWVAYADRPDRPVAQSHAGYYRGRLAELVAWAPHLTQRQPRHPFDLSLSPPPAHTPTLPQAMVECDVCRALVLDTAESWNGHHWWHMHQSGVQTDPKPRKIQ